MRAAELLRARPVSASTRILAGAAMLLAGLVMFGSVFATPNPLSTGARATQPAGRSATQTQIVPPPPPPAPSNARYRVTIEITFSSATHPGTAPTGAHVSNPVIAAHGNAGAMFVNGGFASAGIESMAETGATAQLRSELRSNAGVGSEQITGGVIGVGTRVVTVDLTQSADLISMVTMLAPSPDWFVGFADRDMFVDGLWVDAVTFPLGSYDAGTDSGTDFNSNDVDTQPRQPISAPRDAAFAAAASQHPFGTVTITRIG